MSGVPFVRMYANDWFTGCLSLKADERGVYISMCVYIWTAGRRVPLDDAEAVRMMGLQFNNYQRIRDALVSKGKVQIHGDGYGIKRAEKELDHARNRTEAGSTARDGRRADETVAGVNAQAANGPDPVRPPTGESPQAGCAVLGAQDGACQPASGGAPMGACQGASAGAPIGTLPGSDEKTVKNQDHIPSTLLLTTKDSAEEVKTPLPPRGPTPFEALTAFEAYNATALRCALPQAAKLTPDRQRKIIARLKDYGLDGWYVAMANIEKSKFLTGGNDLGFRADLDFVVQAKSFGKLHDGGYGNGASHGPTQGTKREAWQMPTRKHETRDEMEMRINAEMEREFARCQ